MLAAGCLLLIMPSIVDRLRSMRLGQFEVQLVRQVAATARKSADTCADSGCDRELDAYATIYTELRGPELKDVRGEVLDRIVQRVAERVRGREVRQGRGQGAVPARYRRSSGCSRWA